MMTEAGLTVLEVVPLTFGVCNLYVGTPSRRPRRDPRRRRPATVIRTDGAGRAAGGGRRSSAR
jgi:hypothetical protein